MIWMNGHFVGYRQGANNVSEFDVTPYLREGENRLAVQVFRWSDGSYLECQDMFRMSGIFRDVYLFNVPQLTCLITKSPLLCAITTKMLPCNSTSM